MPKPGKGQEEHLQRSRTGKRPGWNPVDSREAGSEQGFEGRDKELFLS